MMVGRPRQPYSVTLTANKPDFDGIVDTVTAGGTTNIDPAVGRQTLAWLQDTTRTGRGQFWEWILTIPVLRIPLRLRRNFCRCWGRADNTTARSDGQYVVWESDGDIWAYSNLPGLAWNLTASLPGAGSNVHPNIDNGVLVWASDATGHLRINMLNLSTWIPGTVPSPTVIAEPAGLATVDDDYPDITETGLSGGRPML